MHTNIYVLVLTSVLMVISAMIYQNYISKMKKYTILSFHMLTFCLHPSLHNKTQIKNLALPSYSQLSHHNDQNFL